MYHMQASITEPGQLEGTSCLQDGLWGGFHMTLSKQFQWVSVDRVNGA